MRQGERLLDDSGPEAHIVVIEHRVLAGRYALVLAVQCHHGADSIRPRLGVPPPAVMLSRVEGASCWQTAKLGAICAVLRGVAAAAAAAAAASRGAVAIAAAAVARRAAATAAAAAAGAHEKGVIRLPAVLQARCLSESERSILPVAQENLKHRSNGFA